MDKNRLNQLEELYLQAKEAYYTGEPIMSDDEFDRLEEELRNEDSEVISVVGASTRNLKFQHLSPMLSLSKAQASLDGTLPIEQVNAWFSTFDENEIFESTPKYDGNAVNLVYRYNGTKCLLVNGITRGDKLKGRDVSSKLIKKVPQELIGVTQDVEVRGEVVMPTSIFYQKYSSFKNPRNFVAGFLNKDDSDESLLDEIEFMGIEVRLHDGDYEYPSDTQEWLKTNGFNKHDAYFINFKASEFVEVYYKMKDYREKISPFQLDGFVIKTSEKIRKEIGNSDHHPKWGLAIKFPPKEAVTTITGYKFNVGTTGEITPIITLEPVDLDGTTIKNVAGFNIGYIIKDKLYPGAKVVIAKAGDIIPQIMKVLETGDESKFNKPTKCPSCNGEVEIDGIHLNCINDDCEGKMYKRFMAGIRVMKMDKFGSVTCKTLYDSGFKTMFDMFDSTIFNKENLIKTGNFKEGKTLNSLISEIEKIKTIPLFNVILSLGFDKIGRTASKQLAKMISGKPYSFAGLEKAALIGFNEGEKKRLKVERFITLLESKGIEIEKEVDIVNGIGVELTGSPKDSGFSIKNDLLKFLGEHGYVHKPLKEASILLTDSLTSSSSKMEAARKKGIEIMTYEQLIKKIKS